MGFKNPTGSFEAEKNCFSNVILRGTQLDWIKTDTFIMSGAPFPPPPQKSPVERRCIKLGCIKLAAPCLEAVR